MVTIRETFETPCLHSGPEAGGLQATEAKPKPIQPYSASKLAQPCSSHSASLLLTNADNAKLTVQLLCVESSCHLLRTASEPEPPESRRQESAFESVFCKSPSDLRKSHHTP